MATAWCWINNRRKAQSVEANRKSQTFGVVRLINLLVVLSPYRCAARSKTRSTCSVACTQVISAGRERPEDGWPRFDGHKAE